MVSLEKTINDMKIRQRLMSLEAEKIISGAEEYAKQIKSEAKNVIASEVNAAKALLEEVVERKQCFN